MWGGTIGQFFLLWSLTKSGAEDMCVYRSDPVRQWSGSRGQLVFVLQ
jgi:hypothetical protein